MDLARGWSKWQSNYRITMHNRKVSGARFRHQGLYAALRQWIEAYPPRPPQSPDDLADALKALKAERKAHEKAQQRLVELEKEWQKRWDDDRAARETMTSQSAMLNSVVHELQAVLKEALSANSWSSCRQILYHESLRYVPSAATHGRGGLWQAAAREAEIATRLSRGESVGRLVDSAQLAKVQRWSSSLRDIGTGTSMRM